MFGRSRTPQQRGSCAAVGCLIVIVVVGVLVIVGAVSRSHSGSGGTSDNLWPYERQQIAGDVNDLLIAEQAGNLQHAAQLRESLLKHCQTDAHLGGGTGSDHDAVQRYCQGIGVSVP